MFMYYIAETRARDTHTHTQHSVHVIAIYLTQNSETFRQYTNCKKRRSNNLNLIQIRSNVPLAVVLSPF